MRNLLVLSAIILASLQGYAQVRGFGTRNYVPPPIESCNMSGEGHPCFLFGRADLATWKAEFVSSQLTNFNQFLAYYCENASNGGVFDTFNDARTGIPIYGFILLTWQISGATYPAECTEGAVDAKFDDLFDTMADDAAGNSSDFAALAIGYDWGFNYLDAGQKVAGVVGLQTITDSGTGETPWGHVDGRERCMYPAVGYVFQDDGIDDADADDRISQWDAYAGNDATGLRALNNLLAGSTGGYIEGWGYWNSEILQGISFINLLCYEIYRARVGVDTYATGYNTIMEYSPNWYAYLLAPYKLDLGGGFTYLVTTKAEASMDRPLDATSGTDFALDTSVLLSNMARQYVSSNSDQAELSRWLLENQWTTTGKLTWGGVAAERFGVWVNFIGNNSTASTSPTDLSLPIAKWLNPMGKIFIRDGWLTTGVNTTFEFWAAPWAWINKGLWPNQPGAFSMSGSAPLVEFGGTGVHDFNYAYTPWGGSTIIFPNTTETRGGKFYWNKGGARAPQAFGTINSTADLATDSEFDIGGLKTTGCSGGATGGPCGRIDLTDGTALHTYSYAYSDLTRSYNGPQNHDSENLQTVVNFERQFACFPTGTPGTDPFHCVIYDRTESTGANIEKRSQVYFPGNTTTTTPDFTVTGSSGTDTVNRGGLLNCTASHTHTRYIDPTGITISYGPVNGVSGKGYIQPLLPASRYIVTVGGPNMAGAMRQSGGHDAEDPFGCQGGAVGSENALASSNGSFYYLWESPWRAEIIAQSQTDVQQFLMLVSRVQTSTMSAPAAVLLSGTNTTGMKIDSNRCFIAKTTTGILTTGNFELTTTGTFDCLIADLTASGNETFTIGANITSMTLISTGDTDLTYTATAQGTLWVRIVVGSAGSGASNRISW